MKSLYQFLAFGILLTIVVAVAGIMRARSDTKRQLQRLVQPEEKRDDTVGAFRVFPGQCYIGKNAGTDVAWSDNSHVFIGPNAGNGYKRQDELPLVEFTDGNGRIMFQIDAQGKYKLKISEEELVKIFRNYDFQGRNWEPDKEKYPLNDKGQPQYLYTGGNVEGDLD